MVNLLSANNFYGDPTLQDIILRNIVDYMRYGLLEIGAYYNIEIDQNNIFGTNESILQPILNVSGITNYTRYRGFKPDWVWETGIILSFTGGNSPIEISGILVDGGFVGTGAKFSGTGYHIDYPNGHIVFDNPLDSANIVKCPHTIRWVSVYEDEGYIYRKLTTDWISKTGGSGLNYDIQERAYLPAIFVGINTMRTLRGIELGGHGKVAEINIEFNLLSANPSDNRKLTDICYMMENKTIQMYNLKTAPRPLNISGSINNGALTFPAMVSGYPANNYSRFFENSKYQKLKHSPLPVYHSKVTVGLECNVFPV